LENVRKTGEQRIDDDPVANHFHQNVDVSRAFGEETTTPQVCDQYD
jgi:hypothetical protein